MRTPLPLHSSRALKQEHYKEVAASIQSLLSADTDWVAAMATIVCELHHAFDYFHWTGFYRVVRKDHLQIGPYQGGHGCLDIPFSRGVCGAAARTRQTQLVPDVEAFPGHIACSSSTRSEIVVPVIDPKGNLLAVLDIDSDQPAAFDEADQAGLEQICGLYAARYPQSMKG
jgi:L-methionine (R)-S-oxide reductase